MDLSDEVAEGKVDWKGRPALKHKHGGKKASFLVLVPYGFENLALFSLAVNLVTYFLVYLHFTIAESANNLTNFMGFIYLLSLIMAFFADSVIGRFKTALVSGCIEATGLALLTVQAHYPSLRPAPCNVFDPEGHSECQQISGGHKVLFFVSLYMMALGSGGMKATLPAHGADQFDEKDPKEVSEMSSFFNLLLLALCIGGSISLGFLVWIEDNKGWDWGFGLSTLSVLLGLLFLLAGWPIYRMQVISSKTNAFLEMLQVYVAAVRNRNLIHPYDHRDLYEIPEEQRSGSDIEIVPHTNAIKFLDKAAIQPPLRDFSSSRVSASSVEPSLPPPPSPWRLCRVTQVENAKTLLGMLPIFGCTIIMTLCLAQLQTFSIQQGYTMNKSITKHFKMSPASLPILSVAFLIVVIPLYDKIVVPLMRNITGVPTGISHLQRIGIGLVLSVISMAVAAIVEVKRKNVARAHNMLDANPAVQSIPISIFWLAFQYFILGIADMFTYVGLLEFFYSEAPKELKSFSTCFLWTSMALGYFLSTILVKIVNRATGHETKSGGWLAGNNINRNHLNLFYWLLSAMSLFNLFVYLLASVNYKYRTNQNSSSLVLKLNYDEESVVEDNRPSPSRVRDI